MQSKCNVGAEDNVFASAKYDVGVENNVFASTEIIPLLQRKYNASIDVEDNAFMSKYCDDVEHDTFASVKYDANKEDNAFASVMITPLLRRKCNADVEDNAFASAGMLC
ncbi:hypothetical protein HAX54_026145 [Datura stramonium]|uniref:Uncharacterized protein n=1 Tax=Datura stramonium TaxID=4076 RepID=A0ABS8V0P4_DATST|nr:hypothetical protein [Datura stramonium]